MQVPMNVNGCHYSVIYLGNQTLAYPFGWRNDRWLRNVVELQHGKPLIDQQVNGCSPKGCPDRGATTIKPTLETPEPVQKTTEEILTGVGHIFNYVKIHDYKTIYITLMKFYHHE